MFIPLAPTTSSSSLQAPPVDDGISTVKQYLFIYSKKIRTSATIKKYYCNWQKTSNAEPTVSTQAPFLTDAVQKCVDTAAEAIAKHRQAKLVFMQGVMRRILRDVYQDAPPSQLGLQLGNHLFLHHFQLDQFHIWLPNPIIIMDNFMFLEILPKYIYILIPQFSYLS